jgi:hypothetical protein
MIHRVFDNCDPRIRFELELPSEDGSLSLLDFNIKIINGKPIFSFYQKPCRKPVFVHARSGIPKHQLRNIVNNELTRIKSRCSLSVDKKRCVNKFQRMLSDRGHNVDNTVVRRNRFQHENDNQLFFLNIPFISDKVNGMVYKALKPLGLRVVLSHKSKHLVNMLRKTTVNEQKACGFKKCVLKSKNCTNTHVVYEMECNKCRSNYIGSTKRPLHQRVKEHVTMKSSLVYQHNVRCGNGGWKTMVLYTSHHVQQMRFMEAMLIKRRAPSINGKENVFNDHIVF